MVPAVAPVVTTPGRKFPFRTIGLGLIAIILVAVLGFAVYRFVLPLLGVGQTSKKEVTLTWWGLWEDAAVVAPLIAEYQQKNPNVKVNYVMQAKEDYRERLTNALAQGRGPDIFRFHNTWVPMFKAELAPIPSTVMSSSDFSQSYFPVVQTDLAGSGGFVGLPLEFDALGLYVNEEIFNTQGKTPPTTWDDLRTIAKELTIKDENGLIRQAGVALGRTENVDHWPEILGLMMLQNRVKMAAPTGELAEDALNFYSVFATVDGVWDETLPPSTQAFANGRLAMYLGPSWRAHEIRQINPNLKFKVFPVPQLPKLTPDEGDISYATYWAEGVWERGANKEVAWDFLKFMASKESLQKLYQNASQTRGFGEPYPRTDMQELLLADPVVGAFVAQGPSAKTWYLQSRTFDGPTGINSQINTYFEDAVNAVNSGDRASEALTVASSGVNQVLSNYELVAPLGTPASR
jgi:multiple sugar transport system substrate-binding protein